MGVFFRTAEFDEWLKALSDPWRRDLLLLCGGDKSTQRRDISKAKVLRTRVENEP